MNENLQNNQNRPNIDIEEEKHFIDFSSHKFEERYFSEQQSLQGSKNENSSFLPGGDISKIRNFDKKPHEENILFKENSAKK